MAIYISGVKGLPEQVQENKENIKTIQEEIEGIDFEAIRQLEEQVAENTGDINNLEGSVGVQNIAIADHEERLDTLEPKVSALESKTSQIAYDSDNDSTNIGASVKVYGNGEIEARQLTALDTHYKDGEISNGVSGIYLVQDGLTAVRIFNNNSGTNHILDFNDDGSLEVDGNPVGTKYYRHIIGFTDSIAFYSFEVISTQATAYTNDTLLAYLQSWRTGNYRGIKFSLIGVASNNAVQIASLYVGQNKWTMYRGSTPQDYTQLTSFIDTVYEI